MQTTTYTLAYLTIDGDPTCEACFNAQTGGEKTDCRTRNGNEGERCAICRCSLSPSYAVDWSGRRLDGPWYNFGRTPYTA